MAAVFPYLLRPEPAWSTPGEAEGPGRMPEGWPGEELPAPGRVLLGIGPAAVARLRRLAVQLPQAAYVRGDRPGFWWELPVAANLEWERLARWGEAPEGVRWAERITAALGLRERLRLYPAALSPGERAALDLALALMRRPWILLWEEPLFGLDRDERRTLARAVRRLGRQLGFGIAAASAGSLTALRDLAATGAERSALAAR